MFDGVLRSRPGDGRLDDEAVSGLTTGMVSSAQLDSLDSCACACANLALMLAWKTWQRSIPRGQSWKPRETGLEREEA